jgi:hypothetical protein
VRAWYNHLVKLALSVLAAVLAVAAGTGCSGNNNQTGSAPATTGPTLSNWAKQINVACKPTQNRINAVTPSPTDAASLQRWLVRALPLIREQVAAVRSVKPPAKAADAKKARLFLAAIQKTERDLTRYLAAVHANKPAKASKAQADASAAGAATRGYAQSLHITGCGGS